jgi:hypothetical protein
MLIQRFGLVLRRAHFMEKDEKNFQELEPSVEHLEQDLFIYLRLASNGSKSFQTKNPQF